MIIVTHNHSPSSRLLGKATPDAYCASVPANYVQGRPPPGCRRSELHATSRCRQTFALPSPSPVAPGPHPPHASRWSGPRKRSCTQIMAATNPSQGGNRQETVKAPLMSPLSGHSTPLLSVGLASASQSPLPMSLPRVIHGEGHWAGAQSQPRLFCNRGALGARGR